MSKIKSTARKGKQKATTAVSIETTKNAVALPAAFLDTLALHGIPSPTEEIIANSFTRWGSSYYAVAVGQGIHFGDWATGIKETWFPDSNGKISKKEREIRNAAIAAAKQKAEKLRQEEHEAAAIAAQASWEKASTNGKNAYLTKKMVQGFGIRYDGSTAIIVPVRDMQGTMSSLQYIYADGAKRFFPNGRVQGCFHAIGEIENSKPILVAEGYATAASGHMAMNMPVIVAFNAGNLQPVISALRTKYPDSPIVIMGDDDCWKKDKQGNPLPNTGRNKSEEAAQRYGCHCAFPIFAEASQEKQLTDFNDLHCFEGIEIVKQQLEAALRKEPSAKIPSSFKIHKDAVYFCTPKSVQILCRPPLHIAASTHDEEDKNHGVLLKWTTQRTKTEHEWAMPMRLIAGNEQEIRQKLLDEGIKLNPSQEGRVELINYLQEVEPAKILISISRIGWHNESFALPDVVYPNDGSKVLQTDNLYFKGFKTSGTLEEWQQHVACYAKDNTRLILALAVAFAAPLLDIIGEESGAVHLIGSSSLGKTTALRIAGSVWGGGGDNGFIKQWRATGNALEAVAETHRDCLLALDELSQADARSVGEIIYMLANNQGKSRMRSSATLRKEYEWRLAILSSGEISLEEKMAEVQRKPLAGMDVRFVNVPADAGKRLGIFDTVHGFDDGDAFARHFREACGKYYGTPIRAFLAHVVGDRAKIGAYIRTLRQQFNKDNVPAHSDGQVQRVAGRFGLIAAAGELAIQYGVLPFVAGDVLVAISHCFKAWIEARGTTGALEVEYGIARVREYLEKHGENKFVPLLSKAHSNVTLQETVTPTDDRIRERMGYREMMDGEIHYFIYPAAFKDMCKGAVKDIAKEMVKRGFLQKDNEGKTQVNKRVPGSKGQIRLYHVLPAIFGNEGTASDSTTEKEKSAPSNPEIVDEVMELLQTKRKKKP